MKSLLLIFCFAVSANFVNAQRLNQYFDGADTSVTNSLLIKLDTSSSNIWQIGRPQKTLFNSAATAPNAIVTDTINTYPSNNISRFMFGISPKTWLYGIVGLRWKQKLDFDKKTDGGIIEYSTDTGVTWHNVFNNPYIYRFYGFNISNEDTLLTGEYAFSGTDTLWRDIWLCFDASYFHSADTFQVRFTMKSDTIDNHKEGWLIDNFFAQRTLIHTVVRVEPDNNYLKVYPTVTNGIVNIEAEKLQRYHVIQSILLYNAEGKLIQEYGLSPTKFFIDISRFTDGPYFLKVNTNIKSETFRVFLKK